MSFKRKVIKGFIWSFLGQSSYLAISLVANLILARILMPEDFGKIGVVMFFIAISKVVSESGMSGALIRKKKVTNTDYTTVFIFNIVLSLFLALILILSSNFIGEYYKDDSISEILIVLSSVLIINSFRIVQYTKLIRSLDYRKKSVIELIGVFTGASVGITLAVFNYGVWSIVYMQIVTAFVTTLLFWMVEGKIGKLIFSFESFKGLYRFGINTTVASILNTGFDNIYNLILGKYFSLSQTGFYFQAKKLQEVPVGMVKSATLGVAFSSLSRLQGENAKFDLFYNKLTKGFTVLLSLISLLLFTYAEQIIVLFYGDKWIKATFYMQILALAAFFYMQEMFNRILFKIFDRTDKILYLEVIKKAIQSISIVIGVVYSSLEILMYGFLVTSIISYFINYYHSRLIYRSFSWNEVLLIFKVTTLAVLNYLLVSFVGEYYELNNMYFLCLIPLSLILFVISVFSFKVISLKDIKELKEV
ncbi:lipopolysaccharide biosynthesis protein [Tenacibaculum sp. IB213877]|uniref:lipopolysaccharide biosynthesis protein n=1 Tax=Tenacibaculum sp. IB213877 TaxID=3097351 RepID=UPI002A59A898|nr:lipopolysaccharide biosynthesis protein [Tenacibaculum sp. IB213877]MDY0781366.1 lipopolysaccharide biosynthesis protein [Tenacibaculum sp. IB213877]